MSTLPPIVPALIDPESRRTRMFPPIVFATTSPPELSRRMSPPIVRSTAPFGALGTSMSPPIVLRTIFESAIAVSGRRRSRHARFLIRSSTFITAFGLTSMRLGQTIAARFPDVSRRKARELIAAKRVLVNERVVGVASREVSDSDRIAIVEDAPQLDVIASTADWIAVNKPAGMPAQPTRDRKTRPLEELLRVQFREVHCVPPLS